MAKMAKQVIRDRNSPAENEEVRQEVERAEEDKSSRRPRSTEGPLPEEEAVGDSGRFQVPLEETQQEEGDQPELEQIELGGQTYSLPPAIAEALRTRSSEHQSELDQLRRDIQDLKTRPPVERKPQEDADDPLKGIETLLFTDPKKAATLIRDLAVQSVAEPLRQEYNQAERTKQFWTDFYKQNSHLKDDDDMVQLVLSKNKDRLFGMQADKAMKELGRLTDEAIVAVIKRRGGTVPARKGTTDVEQGGNRKTAGRKGGQAESEEDGQYGRTLSDAIRMRRERRRQAAQHLT